jgi:hypothetical protein
MGFRQEYTTERLIAAGDDNRKITVTEDTYVIGCFLELISNKMVK